MLRTQCGVKHDFCAKVVHRLVREREQEHKQTNSDIEAQSVLERGCYPNPEEDYQIVQGISQCFPGMMNQKGGWGPSQVKEERQREACLKAQG